MQILNFKHNDERLPEFSSTDAIDLSDGIGRTLWNFNTSCILKQNI